MPPKKNNKTVHWTYNDEIIDHIDKTPKDSYGFIYCITLLDGTLS